MSKEIINQVALIVAEHFNTTVENIHSTRKLRLRNILFVRQILFYILKKNYNYTYKVIGSHFGKDHSTVINNVKLIKNWISINDAQTMDALSEILPKLAMLENNEKVFLLLDFEKSMLNHFGGLDKMVMQIKSFVNSQCEPTKPNIKKGNDSST